MKTQFVIDAFLKNKRRNVRSLERYNQILNNFKSTYPELPITSFEINDWLSSIKGSDSNLYTYYSVVRALYKFGFEMLDIPDPFKKLHAPKIKHKEHLIWTPFQLTKILSTAKPGLELTLCLVLLDSTCRIGALGKHETTPGNFYPGLNIKDLADNGFTCSDDKTGTRHYRCLPEIINLMRNLANPEGYIFTSNTGKVMDSHYMARVVRKIVISAGITGNKRGAHSFRHLGGSLIARSTRSALAVKAILNHDKIDTSMGYIHEVENDIQQEISPLKLAGQSIENIRHQNDKQQLLLTNNTELNSTSLTSTEENSKITEGTIDLTEELFPNIPDLKKPIRTTLNKEELLTIRRAFVYYSRYSPINGDSAKLSGLLKRMFRKEKG